MVFVYAASGINRATSQGVARACRMTLVKGQRSRVIAESRAIILLVAAWPCFAQRPCSMS